MYPKSLEDLIVSFEKLPGVGKKTAERYAYFIANRFTLEDVKTMSQSLQNVKEKIHRCPTCGFLTESDFCDFCLDSSRDQNTILVVEEPKDVIAMEKCGRYHGLYHVLNGVISPLNGIGPDELNINSLVKRLEDHKVDEVIVATSATVEGEATALFLSRIISPLPIRVTRIAYGLPVGSSLEYSDETTILKALEGRKPIK